MTLAGQVVAPVGIKRGDIRGHLKGALLRSEGTDHHGRCPRVLVRLSRRSGELRRFLDQFLHVPDDHPQSYAVALKLFFCAKLSIIQRMVNEVATDWPERIKPQPHFV